MARWALFLQGFSYKVVYRKGEENNVDALSRLIQNSNNSEDSEHVAIPVQMASAENQNNKPHMICNAPLLNNDQSKAQLSNSVSYLQSEEIITSPKQTDQETLKINEDHKWLELTFELNRIENICSLDTDQNNVKQTENLENTIVIITQQHACSDFKHIYKYIDTNELPTDEKIKRSIPFEKQDYDLLDGILMHRYRPRSRKKPVDEAFIFQVALPQKLRLKVMQGFHDNNGHVGFKKTYAAIQAKYYWPKMFQDISDFVMSCERCQRAKRDAHPNTTQLNPNRTTN